MIKKGDRLEQGRGAVAFFSDVFGDDSRRERYPGHAEEQKQVQEQHFIVAAIDEREQAGVVYVRRLLFDSRT